MHIFKTRVAFIDIGMPEGSNRSRDNGAARRRDLFEAGLNEAAVAFATTYGRSKRDAGFRRHYLAFEKPGCADDELLEGRG